MNAIAPIEETSTPIQGLRAFVTAWRETVLSNESDLEHSKQSMISRVKRALRPPLPQETKDAFIAVLDAMDRYLTEEVEPRYATQADMRKSLDDYWHARSDMYDPCTHILPATNNGLSVARSYLDMILDFMQIGAGTQAFSDMRDASNAFKERVYGKSSAADRSR